MYLFSILSIKIEEFKKSSEYSLYREIRDHRIGTSILKENYRDFLNITNYHNNQSNDAKIWNMNSGNFRWIIQKRIIKSINNYLSAAFTLVDYTRVRSRNFFEIEEKFRMVYEKKVKETFTLDPLAQFIQGLRNYVVHYHYPKIISNIHYLAAGKNIERKIELKKSDLLKFEDWNSQAMRFLESSKDQIDVKNVIKEYNEKVLVFQNWFYIEILKLNTDSLKKLFNEMQILQAWAIGMNMTQSLPFNSSIIRYLGIIINKIERS